MGALKILLLGGGQGHSVAARGSPDLGQDVLPAIMLENQLFRLLGRRFRPDRSLHSYACLDVADRDDGRTRLSLDGVVAGGHLRRSHLERKGDMGFNTALSIGSGGDEHERQNHKRRCGDRADFHDILLGFLAMEPKLNLSLKLSALWP